MSTTGNGQFYSTERLKALPILEVCKKFGVVPELKGNSYWVKIRDEKTASAQLHLDKNTFYDFGSHTGGDVIQLVSDLEGIGFKDAKIRLADAFGITPETKRNKRTYYELDDWEYKQIGLAADLATKNFSFNVDKQSIERIAEISARYSMPMNELRKKHPKIYSRLLRDKAIPYVRDLRKNYYIALYSEYYLCKQLDAESAFLNTTSQNWFRNNCIKELQNAEAVLIRACHGTDIRAYPVAEYDPIEDIKKLLNGEVKPSVGMTDYSILKKEATQLNTKVISETVDFGKYLSGGLDNFMHSASLVEGNVIVRYLECDRASIKPFLQKMQLMGNSNLDDKISSAKGRQGAGIKHSTERGIKNNKER